MAFEMDAHAWRKALSKVDIVADPDDKRHEREEIALVDALRDSGLAKDPTWLNRVSMNILDIVGGKDFEADAYKRRELIRQTAESVAKDRGDDLEQGFIKGYVIPNSELAQKRYRDYLHHVLDERTQGNDTHFRDLAKSDSALHNHKR